MAPNPILALPLGVSASSAVEWNDASSSGFSGELVKGSSKIWKRSTKGGAEFKLEGMLSRRGILGVFLEEVSFWGNLGDGWQHKVGWLGKVGLRSVPGNEHTIHKGPKNGSHVPLHTTIGLRDPHLHLQLSRLLPPIRLS